MEREPLQPLPFFRLELADGTEFHCNPQNLRVFLHSDKPEYDHLFPFEVEDDNIIKGHYIFREQIGHFDELIDRLSISGYVFHEKDVPTDDDIEAYDEFQALKQRNILLQQAARQEGAYNLTPRQERLADFVAYLLLHEHLSADDFNGSGELYI